MYTKKAPKGQQPDKDPYTEYNPHLKSRPVGQWDLYDSYKVISIDPGTKNFAIRVELRPAKQVEGSTIRPLLYERLRLTDEVDSDTSSTVYDALTQFFDQHKPIFEDVHFVIIERQLPINYRAVRIAQHAFTYFMITLKGNKVMTRFIEVDPKLKGKELGAPAHLTEKGLKEWSVVKAKELFKARGDAVSLATLQKSKIKADDLADTAVQIEALFKHLNLPLTPLPVIAEMSISEQSLKILDIPGLKFPSPLNTASQTLQPTLQPTLQLVPKAASTPKRASKGRSRKQVQNHTNEQTPDKKQELADFLNKLQQ